MEVKGRRDGRIEVEPSEPQVQDAVQNPELERVRAWPQEPRRRHDLARRPFAAWTPAKTGLRGGQRRYSNLAILTALTLRVVFRLPLRQTEGFLDSLLSLMGPDLKAPDHTTLSRRKQVVEDPALTRAHEGPIHLVVDSTGLKIMGSGEWNTHKYQAPKRRQDSWKLHIGVDDEEFIVAAELTPSSGDDASTLPDLLDQTEDPIRRFNADGHTITGRSTIGSRWLVQRTS